MPKPITLLGVIPLVAWACAHQPAEVASPRAPKPEPAAAPAPAAPVARPAPVPADWLAHAPPLIDREILFGDPEITGAQLSPDGAFLSFLKTWKGQLNVWVKKREEPFTAARPLTADAARPVTDYFWSRDGRFVLFAQDQGGDENDHVYAVDPKAPADAATGVPVPRDLTPVPKAKAMIVAVSKYTPGSILIGLNDRDPQAHDVYRLELATGKRTLVRKNTENVLGWLADRHGALRGAFRVTQDGGSEMLRLDGDKLVPFYACSPDETCEPVGFHKDGKRLYVQTNRGAADLTALALVEVASGKETQVESDPDQQVDFGGAFFSEATDELAATFYDGDRMRIYPKTKTAKRVLDDVRKALPEADLTFSSATRDERFVLVVVRSDVDPGATYLYDAKSHKLAFQFRPYAKLPPEQLSPMTPVRYRARDGVEIPAYLTIPKGSPGKDLAAVILPHGGPWGRDHWGFNPFAQLLANRGYAVLQPNFRGSVGFGKRFMNLGNGQWGTGTMQHDLTDAAAYLASQGIARRDQIAIMGGSYGGYATLAGLAFTPEVYACGVDIVGPSSIITLFRSIPPYWKPFVRIFHARVGDPDKPADAARLRAQSPLYSATSITRPLLVIQGANDPRVKKPESDRIVSALRDLGRTVEYIVAPDEGHGFARRENRIAMMAAIEAFLARHLPGRAQASMSPEIAARLGAIRVDPATVKAPPEPAP